MSVGIVVGWQWLPFATLILLTALQSLDEEQKDAAEMDGAGKLDFFRYIVLPHLARPITVVILIETIFLLNVFAEIKVTSVGGLAGNLTYLVFSQLNDANDVGDASAGGLIAVVLANIVAIFLVRHRSAAIWRPDPWRDGQPSLRCRRDDPGLDRSACYLLPDPVDGADRVQVARPTPTRCRRTGGRPLDAREFRHRAGALQLSALRRQHDRHLARFDPARPR